MQRSSFATLRRVLSRSLLAPTARRSCNIYATMNGKKAFSSLSTVHPAMMKSPTQSRFIESLPLSPALASTLRRQTRSMVVVTKTKGGTVPNNEDFTEDSLLAAAATNVQSTTTTTSQEEEGNLIITDACWKQILRLAAKKNLQPSEMFLRVYVDAGGCSGFEYKFEVETDPDNAMEEDDLVWSGPQGARVVVDEGSLAFIQGATLDFVEEMIKSAFTVRDNPLSESACGCGSSFAVKNFSANPALD